jgi:hypothetical protein
VMDEVSAGRGRAFVLRSLFCVWAAVVASVALANQPKDIQVAPDSPHLGFDRVNVSVDRFLAALAHSDPIERERANHYLLGVMDTTEGRVWCSYRILKSISVREIVYYELGRLPAERRKDRAAKAIEEALQKTNPCGRKP